MKTAKEYSDTAKREVSVDVNALLAAINEISESEVHRSQNDSEHVSVDGRRMPSNWIFMTSASLK